MEPEELGSSEEKNKGEVNIIEIQKDLSKEKTKNQTRAEMEEVLPPSPLLNHLLLTWDGKCQSG